MGVHSSGSNNTPQVNERLVVIEETYKHLGDTIKNLNTDVKDAITTLQLGVIELVATVNVIMMAMAKSLEDGGASECKGKDKVLEPKLNAGERNA